MLCGLHADATCESGGESGHSLLLLHPHPLLLVFLFIHSSEVCGQCLHRLGLHTHTGGVGGGAVTIGNPHYPHHTHTSRSLLTCGCQWTRLEKLFFHPCIPPSHTQVWLLVLRVVASSWESSPPTRWCCDTGKVAFEDEQLHCATRPHCSTLELTHLNPLIDGSSSLLFSSPLFSSVSAWRAHE